MSVYLALSASVAWGDPTVQLRLAWGGGTVGKQWQGTVSIDSGTLAIVRPLGIEADEPGSMWIDDGRLEIHARSVREYDGVDILVTAPLDATLSFEFHADDTPVAAKASLEEMMGKGWAKELDKAGNRLLVRRAPGDMLRVVPHHEHLVFAPHETLRIDVEPRLLPVAEGTAIQLRAKLLSEAGNELASHEESIKTTAEASVPASIPWKFELPEHEGTFTLVVEAFEASGLRWAKPKLVAERHVQLVVVTDDPRPPADGGLAWSRVMEIDPANPRWYERFKSWSLFPALAQGPLGNGGMQISQHALGPVANLLPRAAGADPHWEAYPLTIARPGVPHVLEVEYPSDVPQTLGISIVEPNAAGAVLPIGLDSGVFSVSDDAPRAGQWLRHRVIFWPHTKAPLLLLTNRRDGSPAAYRKIRVLAGPSHLPRGFPAGDLSERLLAGYLGRPLMPENFGGPEILDPWSGRSLDDWQTFSSAIVRLAEYSNHIGYGGQMVSVLAEGSTIYPSTLLEPSSRYDTGAFFDMAQDPLRKDVLELALRVFDREKLKLIPALQFAAPLPALEAELRRGGQHADGIRLIGPEGAAYVEANPPQRGIGAYYNPLNEHVQEAMLAVVREVVQRYSAHPSFAGLAIELTADGYAQLPGELWGLDDTTIAQFERDTRIRVPGRGDGRFAERAEFLAQPRSRDAWLNWRAEVMAQFYRRLQDELTGARRDAVLYLAPTNLFDSPEVQRMLRPALPAAGGFEEALLALGIRPDLLKDAHGLVLLRTQRVQPPGPLAAQAGAIELDRAAEADAACRGPDGAGSLFVHDPQTASLPSFDAQSPYGKNSTYTWLVSHISPSGERNRQRFVHALASMDSEAIFDGGWMLPLGQEETLADFIAAYRRLPAGKFETHSAAIQPVTIRSLATYKSTFAYIVNDSQWPVSVRLQCDLPAGCRIEELSGRRRLPAMNAAGWTLALEPYDLVAVRFWSREAKITKAELLPHPQLKATLDRRVNELKARMATLVNPPPLAALVNADFEQLPKADRIPGWSLVNPKVGQVAIENDPQPQVQGKPAGRQAAKLASNGPIVSLHSEPFAPPPTGRLNMILWLRVDDPQNPPPLRLALEGLHEGRPYYRFGQVGPGANAIAGDWSQYHLPFNDLPVVGLDQLRVRFDLMGRGEVWIDDVRLFDLAFSQEERVQLSKIVALADFQLQAGKLGDCLHELNGYWPQFLSAYVPAAPVAVANQPPAAGDNQQPQQAPEKAPEKAATRPGVIERMRDRWKF